ncbi:MAG: hypothetical protein QG646_1651 [Euryarchaeota archaeon]|nr:hypothetical protein [Euryarchaeota archaeon]
MQQTFQNVIINRQEINSIEFEAESVEIPLSPGGELTFEIMITNHGSPAHVHLSVSDELKGQITFLRDNPYVLQKEFISAVARIPQEGRVLTKGQIFITVGYGSKKRGFPVQLGKVESKPQNHTDDEIYNRVDQEESTQIPGPVQPIKRDSRLQSGSKNGLNWLSSSAFKGFTGGFFTSRGKTTQVNIGKSERLPLTIAFGGFLLLVFLFFLYFILPESLQFEVSFPQSLLFSILFVTSFIYILLKISE